MTVLTPLTVFFLDCLDCLDALGARYTGGGGMAPVPTSSLGDFILGSTAVVTGTPDASSSGTALSSGKPKGGAVFGVRYHIG